MNKQQLIDSIAKEADLSKVEADRAVKAFMKAVQDELASGGSVSLIGFGAFEVRERSARTGRNPQTGEEIQIAASRMPSFKAGKALKDACNPES